MCLLSYLRKVVIKITNDRNLRSNSRLSKKGKIGAIKEMCCKETKKSQMQICVFAFLFVMQHVLLSS